MLLAAIMIGSALLVVGMRDIIRCGLAMIICFAALAGLYVIAGAPVVAAAQVLVYIGAISVLVLFAIMLTQTKAAPEPARVPDPGGSRPRSLSVGAGGPDRGRRRVHRLAGQRGRVCDQTPRSSRPTLFADYTLPFEVVSVLLLAAVIGGVFLAKRERGDGD